jgi:protein subunit release factor B
MTPDHRGRYIIGSDNSRRMLVTIETKLNETEKKLKETEEKLQNAQRNAVNMVSPVAQAVRMAKSEVKRLRDSNIKRRRLRSETRILTGLGSLSKMNNYQLENILKRYPVTVCAAD